jgi:transcriptional regulator with GAF, ATPase, and Fis domain
MLIREFVMKTDANEFFRQVAVQVCGSLDIKTSMKNCLNYIKDFIPIDIMNLWLFDPQLNILKSVASVSRDDNIELVEALPMPNVDLPKWKRSWWQMAEVEIKNRPNLDPTTREIYTKAGLSLDCSLIILRIDHDGRHVGNLTIKVMGKDRYTEEHASLFRMLRELFAITMANALKHHELIKLKDLLADENRYLRSQLHEVSGTKIVGGGFGLKQVMEMARTVAPLKIPVLLRGETGVGKDVIANYIHNVSPRKEGPFIKVNCGAIPDNLIDSELFGHEKGSFTGAITQKVGRFERANKGTIFLDEIGELPLSAQVRLLYIFQNHEIERVGGMVSIPVEIRIICATHRNLEEMIESGEFRQDLWYRLNVFPITIPPLRQRKEDIPALVNYFFEQKSKELALKTFPPLSADALDQLTAYDWPGNVRELENVIERALILHADGILSFDNVLVPHELQSGTIQPFTNGSLPLLSLDEMTIGHIKRTLDMTRGKISGPSGAAQLLKINPNTLRKRMRRLGIFTSKKKHVRLGQAI